ncbi:hypothetical protein Dsin_016577 [Dipteronia sinensis]|uniref:HAT C-terminal dimerisation domain-containing protein n=1 Tax=Dipteronia sinensis TaxID=43782 RepID=A0AAE0ADD6_9ROSI|nr:hypothetical protein Dsin_016577 [Dipteronia sinensis]
MKGKGRMTDNLGHDDRAYHEYLQHQVYAEDLGLNFPQSHSHPSLRISEPYLNVTPILTSQSENMSDLGHDGNEPNGPDGDGPDPNPHQDFDFDPQMEEKLPKQVGFNNYCQQALNPAACRVPRTTLTEALENIYEKEKKMLEKILEKYNGRVSVCADIWSDHWRMHSYIGVTCHYMDNALAIQKRILAFRVFDDKHTAANIFRHLTIIFTEYKIENKIFAIGFDNASNNTAAIPALIELCKPYLGEDTEDKKFDILHWWKEHERYFPILAMIAKQILSTPVSTVAVEQQFSAGGNILDPKRSLKSPKSLQIQACVEDWTKA